LARFYFKTCVAFGNLVFSKFLFKTFQTIAKKKNTIKRSLLLNSLLRELETKGVEAINLKIYCISKEF
jgi:hypothetical protein